MKDKISSAEPRFAFGQNWADYITHTSDQHVAIARTALAEFLGLTDLSGKSFLDIGCGSGIHSLAALQMHASRVISFDYDTSSVETCRRLKAAHAPEAAQWDIFREDIVLPRHIQNLGPFDIVYAWGVLHHTGQMWRAIENAAREVAPGGLFYLAIYNRHWTSPYWKKIKALYNRSPRLIQKGLLGFYAAADFMRIGVKTRRNPFAYIAEYQRSRGMRWYNDLRDWLGGYPFEYATAEEIEDFCRPLGLETVRTQPNRSTGCSELLFRRRQA